MSAFLVDQKTINQILTYLVKTPEDSPLRIPLLKIGYNLNDAFCVQRLGEAMVELNIFSLQERYPHDWIDMIYDDAFLLEFEPCQNKAQPLKSLHCFTYQACEGRAEDDELFKALYEIEDMMPDFRRTQEYDDADWG